MRPDCGALGQQIKKGLKSVLILGGNILLYLTKKRKLIGLM